MSSLSGNCRGDRILLDADRKPRRVPGPPTGETKQDSGDATRRVLTGAPLRAPSCVGMTRRARLSRGLTDYMIRQFAFLFKRKVEYLTFKICVERFDHLMQLAWGRAMPSCS